MPLTLAAIDALINDNAAGDISAADMRSVARALHRKNVGAYSLDDAADIWWEGDSAGMTTVTVTGSQTLTEMDGFLSVNMIGQTAADMNCLLKAHTFSVGDSFCARLGIVGGSQSQACVIFTDGTASSSSMMYGGIVSDGGVGKFWQASGTLTSWAGNFNDTFNNYGGGRSDIYAKLVYVATNSWRVWYSTDGVSWMTPFVAVSFTLAPTHVGIGWMTTVATPGAVATYGPLCKVA